MGAQSSGLRLPEPCQGSQELLEGWHSPYTAQRPFQLLLMKFLLHSGFIFPSFLQLLLQKLLIRNTGLC